MILVCIMVELVKGVGLEQVIWIVKGYVEVMICDMIQVGYGYGLLNYWVLQRVVNNLISRLYD